MARDYGPPSVGRGGGIAFVGAGGRGMGSGVSVMVPVGDVGVPEGFGIGHHPVLEPLGLIEGIGPIGPM